MDDPQVREFVRGVVRYGDTTLTLLENLYDAAARDQGLTYISAVTVIEKSVWDYNQGNPSGNPATLGKRAPPQIPLVAIDPKDGTLISDGPFLVLTAEWVNDAKRPPLRTSSRSCATRAAAALPGRGVPQLRGRARRPDQQSQRDAPRHRDRRSRPARTRGAERVDGDPGPFRVLVPPGTAGAVRDAYTREIGALTPQGGTALYRTTRAAVAQIRSSFDPNRINAVVLLSAGKNEDKLDNDLDGLLRDLEAGDRGTTVRVFPIAYGEDADLAVLTRIAKATAYDAGDATSVEKVVINVVSNF